MTCFSSRVIRKLRKDETGSIAVEFALVAPVLLLIVAGVIDIGSATSVKLSLDARVTTTAEYALLQSAPGDREAAEALAGKLAGLLQGDSSVTATVDVNNAARAEWTGETVTVATGPGKPENCYCPTFSGTKIEWGHPVGCGLDCASGDSAGQFVQVSATAQHVPIFLGHALLIATEI